jgi:hypothetical protein
LFFFSNTDSNVIKYICVIYFHFFVFLDVLFRTFDVILQWRQNMCHVIFHVWGFSWRKILYFQQHISEKSSNISRKLLSLSIGITKINFMWCVFHNAQFYDIDLIFLCKLVTDQWRGSLGVHDSESCWFTEEKGTYMRCWESPGDLQLVIEILFLFARFAALYSRKDITFLSLVEDHPVFPKNVCKNLLFLSGPIIGVQTPVTYFLKDYRYSYLGL